MGLAGNVIGLLNRLRRDSTGATAVEFALVAVPLITMLLAGFDLAYQAYLQSVVQGALNDVARSASLEAPDLNCTADDLVGQIQCAIKTRADIVARDATYEVEVNNYFDFSGVGRSEKLVTDYNQNGSYDAGDCFVDLNQNNTYDLSAGRSGVGGGDDVAFYEVTVRMPRLFAVGDFLPASSEYVIRAQTALRNQPYTRQRVPPTVCR